MRIDAGLCERATEELLRREQSILRIEKERHEHFVRAAAEREQQEVAYGARRGQAVALADVFDQRPAHQLEHRLELRVLGHAESAHAGELVDRRREQALQAAKMEQKLAT